MSSKMMWQRASKAIAVVVVACATMTLSTTAGASSTPSPTISHQGRWLVDGQGRVLMLRGLNYVPKNAPYEAAVNGFGAADADWLVANGFDAVRLGVLATGLMPTPGKISTTYLNSLAKTVAVLTSHHIYVLLDLHQDGWGPATSTGTPLGSDGFPGWMTLTHGATNNQNASFPLYYVNNPAIQQSFQSLWNNDTGPKGVSLQSAVAEMFGALAKRFGSNPWLLGYDVFNEPWPGTSYSACLSGVGGCPKLDSNELNVLYKKVDKAIRKNDHAHLVLGEPFVLFNFGSAPTTISLPNSDPKSGMSFHMYPATPSGEVPVINYAQTWTKHTGGALLMTEWGATSKPADITRQANELDAGLVPWLYWSFDQGVVHSVAKSPTGNNLESNLIDALVRPNAIAIAGTPTKQAYDSTNDVFTLQWLTRRPGGGTYAKGTISTVSLPSLDYPSGYCAQATGATITSHGSATKMTLVTKPGVLAVSLRVGTTCPTS